MLVHIFMLSLAGLGSLAAGILAYSFPLFGVFERISNGMSFGVYIMWSIIGFFLFLYLAWGLKKRRADALLLTQFFALTYIWVFPIGTLLSIGSIAFLQFEKKNQTFSDSKQDDGVYGDVDLPNLDLD